MRYMLLLHGVETEFRDRTPEQAEEVIGFLSRFEDELASRSELEWTEVLDDSRHADLVDPEGGARPGWFNADGAPLERLWVVRVADQSRAQDLAGLLAAELGTPVEVRECMPTAQRP